MSNVLRRPASRSVDRNPAPSAFAHLEPVHRLIGAQALHTPDRPAVRCGASVLSYSRLNACAGRLAARLRDAGVGRESIVGVLSGRSLDMAVGLLAILKSGAAYLPLEPSYPTDRLAFMVQDAKPTVVLAERAKTDRLPHLDVRVLELDGCRDEGGPVFEDHEVALDRPAYVIYTSGSTGRPKGAVVTHRGFANYLLWAATAYGMRHGSGAPVHSSISFDLTVTGLWVPWICGGCVDLIGDDLGVDALIEAFRKSPGYGLIKITPAHLALLEAAIRPEEAAGKTNAFIIGGEALTADHVAYWLAHAPGTVLINEYGPTETVVGCCAHRVAPDGPSAGPLPIGKPIAGACMYVLDARLRPVPPGVVGDLYIGGAGVARGYLNQPGRTAEAFLPDPFSATPGARMYRTGDLARRRADGVFEFLGRTDDQIKIRGHRIEPGEIEHRLRRHPAVASCAVLARPDAHGQAALTAYVVPHEGRGPTSDEFRTFLAASLPEPMIPAAFVSVDRIPLTPNGKVDREALPAPGDAVAASAYFAPNNDTERRLAAIWSAVLGHERVGVRDDFFAAGGHSLLATQVVARVRDEWDLEIPVRRIFETPTIAELARSIDEDRLRGRSAALPPVRPVDRTGSLALSFSQESLWYLDRLEPGLPTFNVTAALRIRGALDDAALRRSLDEVARRHEALRTVFPLEEGRPVQRILPASGLAIRELDLTQAQPEKREAEAAHAAHADARLPLDLSNGPLVRATLIRLGPEDTALQLTMHHIVTDGWSFAVAARELLALYGAYRDGLPSPLTEPEIQYADYAAWQRATIVGATRERLVDFWKKQLEGIAPLELPTDRPRPPIRSGRGAIRRFVVPADLSAAIVRLGREAGATPFMALLAVFIVLLHRWSGQAGFAVGTPVANRGRSEVEGLIGYFVNTIPLPADLSGTPTFRELLDRVREASIAGFDHQALPLETIVAELQPERDTSRTPLFQAMFVLQTVELGGSAPAGLELLPFESCDGTGTAKFDLSLAMAEAPEGFDAGFEYATDLFDAATVETLVERFLAVIGQVVADPDCPVADLDLAPTGHLVRIAEWNRTPEPLRGPDTLHGLFERSAERAPGAVAFRSDGRDLTYERLDRLADRLAYRLDEYGIGPESRVALVARRCPEFAIGMLGILKAGGVFVPIDPDESIERIRAVLDAEAVQVVVGRKGESLRASLGARRWVDPSELGEEIGRKPDTAISPTNAAYVLCTSGSTGVPKRVVVEHRSVANHALAASELFRLGPDDRVLQFASLTSDIAIEEFFPTWVAGASVVLRDETVTTFAGLDRFLEREDITVIDLPTAFWHAWAADSGGSSRPIPASLRLVVVGGEAAQVGALAAWRRRTGDRVRWLNTYGPTEATVIATAFEASGSDRTPIPIGRPIPGAKAYVLDDRLRPMPIGVPGELYLGGVCVSRGYSGDPRATAEAILPDPFHDALGARLYRTGDRARWLPDGTLEFLGRVDRQLKVRGFRIDPAEIESVLRGLPRVRDAAVAAAADGLVAFVVADDGVDTSGLLSALRHRLPRYSVPSRILRVDRLPSTRNGKVDRDALLEAPPPGADGRHLKSLDETEFAVLAVLQELLPQRAIDRTDDFFNVGGHSLLAIRLLSLIEERCGVSIPLAEFLADPTVAALAETIRLARAGQASGETRPVRLNHATDGVPLYCVHAVGGMASAFRELASHFDDRPFFAFQSIDDLDRDRITVESLAEDYLHALRRTRPSGPYHLAGWSFGASIAFEMAVRLTAQGQDVRTLAVFDAPAPTAIDATIPRRLRLAHDAVLRTELANVAGSPAEQARVAAVITREFASFAGTRLPETLSQMDSLDAIARRSLVLHAFGLGEIHSTAVSLGSAEADRLVRILQANLLAAVRYRPEAVFPGRVHLYRAASRRVLSRDASLGWRAFAPNVVARSIPGDHTSMLSQPGAAVLARGLLKTLQAAEEAAP